jgi:uncharacterized delta-60 repeat protein
LIRKLSVFFLAVSLIMFFPGAPTPPVDLDPSFGGWGVVTTSFGGVNAEYLAVKVLPEGKILTAGGSFDLPNWDFALARYLPEGSLDPTFGQGGKVVTKFGNMASINVMALQPDGKIVVAGTVWIGTSHTAFALARYDASGGLDPTFGDGGKVITDVGAWAGVFAIALQPDGKILLGGNFHYSGTRQDFALLRYTSNGKLDTSFGQQGKAITNFPVSSHPGNVSIGNSVSSLVLLRDGKILAAGSGGGDFVLVRYNPDGSLDQSFGQGGYIKTAFSGISGIQKLLVQPDGKLIAAGFFYAYINNGQRSDIALVRYNRDGSLDPSFGAQGKLTANYGFQDSVIDVAFLPGGQILVAGDANSEQKYVNGFQFLAVYNPDGSLDPACGIDGIKNLTNYPIGIWAITIEPDNELILAGSANQVARLALLRALPGDCLLPG